MAKKASKTAKKSTRKTVSRSSTAGSKTSKSSKKKNGTPRSAAASRTTTKSATKRTTSNGSSKSTAKTRKPAAAAPPAATATVVADEDTRLRDSNGHLTTEELQKLKSGLTKKDLAAFRAMLLEKRAELLGDVQGMEAARAEGSSEHLSPEHMADMGSDAYDQEFTLGLMESERKLLNDIHEALLRIDQGGYGICLQSGEPIPRARLEIKPWARYTIDVVRERERRGLKT